MKLTIEIPDEHRLDVLRFLASLTAAPVEAAPDIAPGHPELPLGIEPENDVPAGHRPLSLGEEIQPGDVFRADNGQICPSGCVGQRFKTSPSGRSCEYHLPHFRPLAERMPDAKP